MIYLIACLTQTLKTKSEKDKHYDNLDDTNHEGEEIDFYSVQLCF